MRGWRRLLTAPRGRGSVWGSDSLRVALNQSLSHAQGSAGCQGGSERLFGEVG